VWNHLKTGRDRDRQSLFLTVTHGADYKNYVGAWWGMDKEGCV